MRIAISPDEDPGDSGSVAADGTTERSVNLKVANALTAALRRCGQDVWFDPSISYVERVDIANGDGTALLVACAHNSSTPGARGTQFVKSILGFGKQDQAADAVYAELSQIPGWPSRRADAIEDVYECWAFNGDTVYIESLFMSPEDKQLWSRPDYPTLAAEATARGLASTYGFPYVPSEDDLTPEQDALLRNTNDAINRVLGLLSRGQQYGPNGQPIPNTPRYVADELEAIKAAVKA